MDRSLEKLSILMVLVSLLMFPKISSTLSEQPFIASRVSEISEILTIPNPEYTEPQTSSFAIKLEVEILNRDDKNQTTVELCDHYPKVFINASFVNKTLELQQQGLCLDVITFTPYSPGITVEKDTVTFYINQAIKLL